MFFSFVPIWEDLQNQQPALIQNLSVYLKDKQGGWTQLLSVLQGRQKGWCHLSRQRLWLAERTHAHVAPTRLFQELLNTCTECTNRGFIEIKTLEAKLTVPAINLRSAVGFPFKGRCMRDRVMLKIWTSAIHELQFKDHDYCSYIWKTIQLQHAIYPASFVLQTQ